MKALATIFALVLTVVSVFVALYAVLLNSKESRQTKRLEPILGVVYQNRNK